MDTTESLLEEITAFCARYGMSETAFGLAVARDGHLVRRLRDGKSMTTRRLDQVKNFMAEHDGSDDDSDPLAGAESVERRAPSHKGAAA